MFAGSIDSIPMKTHFPPDSAIRSTSSSSRSRFALICATHGNCAPAAMMSRSSDLTRLRLMARLSSMKKTATCPRSRLARSPSAAVIPRPRTRWSGSGWSRRRSPSPCRTRSRRDSPCPVSMRTTWNLPQPPPRRFRQRLRERRDEVELVEFERLPRNVRVGLEGRLEVVALGVDARAGRPPSTRRARRPRRCSGHVSSASPRRRRRRGGDHAVPAQSLVGALGDVRAAHHDVDAGGAQGIGDAIGFGDHAGHRTDADQPDIRARGRSGRSRRRPSRGRCRR